MRIAVVGAGIAGLVSAHRLQRRHEVVLFDADRRAGGHTNTALVMEGDRPIPIDTGFIVFNTKTYPAFVSLLGELGVAWTESEMSFSVRSEERNFEYNGKNLSTLFSQRRRVLSPRFWRMITDIKRFYREGRELLEGGAEVPLFEWLRARDYSSAFMDDHLIPLIRAVWSASREIAEEFPARFLVRFFENHGFLQVDDRPGWLTIPGGARSYVRAILSGFKGELRLAAPVRSIERKQGVVVLRADGSEPESFDHVVLACHSDQALALLADPSSIEREILSALPYQRNQAVLHTDASLMPRIHRTWASWNVHLDDQGRNGACVTYWMNRLQPLGAKKNYFLTLNRTDRIRRESILRVQEYAHPVFTLEGLKAQARHEELIDHRNTSYCGAYWRNGFHEDGVASAIRVTDRLDISDRIGVAA